MAGKRTFYPNRPGIKQVPHYETQREWAQATGLAIARQARQLAPVRTGNYRRSIRGRAEHERVGWCAVCRATDFKANWVELGTNGIKKSRVLGRALDAASQATGKVKVKRR